MTKIKAIGRVPEEALLDRKSRVWDTQDVVYPALENGAVFVTTNLILTDGQQLSRCAEAGKKCMNDTGCPIEPINHLSAGVNTGRCLRAPGAKTGACEIEGWCPVEDDTMPLGGKDYLFPMVNEYTLLIKNHVQFPRFGVERSNIPEWASKGFLRTCRFNKTDGKNKYCPVFKLETIFEEIGANKHMFIKGGVVGIDIEWNCDFDWSVEHCKPAYSFRRLDDEDAKISKGFNFRYANYYRDNGTLRRDLIKAYGIRFIINSYGTAGKFHINPFFMNFGSAIGLLSVVPMLCDFIVFNLLPNRNLYSERKTELIDESEDKRDLELESGTGYATSSSD